MLPDYVTSRETSLTIQCHDRMFSKVTALDEDGRTLFRVEGTTLNTALGAIFWTWRRRLVDNAGNHVCDLRHKRFDVCYNWAVEDAQGRRISTLVHSAFLKRGPNSIKVTVHTTAGEEVPIMMLPQDRSALTVAIKIGESTIAIVSKVASNPSIFRDKRDRTVWKATVAAGVDLSLVSSHIYAHEASRCPGYSTNTKPDYGHGTVSC